MRRGEFASTDYCLYGNYFSCSYMQVTMGPDSASTLPIKLAGQKL